MDFGATPNPRNPIRILLVDDNVVYRAGLRALLWKQGDLVVVGEAGTGEEAVACAKATRPHVVLMDLSMPGKGGVWAMRQLTALGVRASVLVLTALSQEWELLEALEAGARGFVEKGGPVEDLVQAIRTVTKGQLFLDADGAKLAVLLFERVDRGIAGIVESDRALQRAPLYPWLHSLTSLELTSA